MASRSKNIVHGLFISDICLIEGETASGNFLYPFQCLFAGIIQIIHNNDSWPSFKSSTHVWLPIYPAPPVTNILMRNTSIVDCWALK